jgi:hypothetical protein
MPYRFLEDIATADIAFEARGETLEEVFTAAAEATMNVMIESLVRPAKASRRSPLISLGSPLVTNSLCRGQERRRMPSESEPNRKSQFKCFFF